MKEADAALHKRAAGQLGLVPGGAAAGPLRSRRSRTRRCPVPNRQSRLEDVIVALLREEGLPEPVRQHRVGGVRVDLAYPAVRLGIEADGRVRHGGRLDVQRNSEKANALVHQGWRTLHFTWADVMDRPSYVVRRARRGLTFAREAVG